MDKTRKKFKKYVAGERNFNVSKVILFCLLLVQHTYSKGPQNSIWKQNLQITQNLRIVSYRWTISSRSETDGNRWRAKSAE